VSRAPRRQGASSLLRRFRLRLRPQHGFDDGVAQFRPLLLRAFDERQNRICPDREAVKLLVLIMVERGWHFQRLATPRPGNGSSRFIAICAMVIEAIEPVPEFSN
jgi:hypothetical protein